jgi:AraC-like DNA-binding protein
VAAPRKPDASGSKRPRRVRNHAGVPASYREFAPPPGLEAHLACVWTSHDRATRVLPDACADIVFDAGQLIVAGPATLATDAPATPGEERCGVRFRIASAGPALGLPAVELLDRQVPLAELWGRSGRRLEVRVRAAQTPEAALAALIRGVAQRLPPPGGGDPLVRRAALALICGGASLRATGRMVGLGERQLRRRFERAVGYGPATLVRVQRFQSFLALAEHQPSSPLLRPAVEAGYADQAHLTRECRRLSGLPPGALLRDGALAAGEKSVSFKRRRAAAATLTG